MKYVKMLGFAALAAMALMLLGAGSASATTLLSTGKPVSQGAVIHAELETKVEAQLTSTDGATLIDKCKVSTAEAVTTNTSGTTVTANISVLHWTECTVTTHTLTKGILHFNEDGTVNGSGTVVTVLFGGVSCRYGTGTGTDLGKLTTGKLALSAVINEQEPKSFICPDTTRWTASYTVTKPHDLTTGA